LKTSLEDKAVVKKTRSTPKRTVELVESLEARLSELQELYDLQFEATANLRDKLTASKRMRTVLKQTRRLQQLIAESLAKLE